VHNWRGRVQVRAVRGETPERVNHWGTAGKLHNFGGAERGHGIYFFLARITPNYLELPRISQNRGPVIMNKIGSMSMSMGEGGYPRK
jgi:hypothetical protein